MKQHLHIRALCVFFLFPALPGLAEPVPGDIIKIAAGGDHSQFVTDDGRLWGMGYNGNGQLGIGVASVESNHIVPAQVAGVENVVSLSTSDSESQFVTGDGKIWKTNRASVTRIFPEMADTGMLAIFFGFQLYITKDKKLVGKGGIHVAIPSAERAFNWTLPGQMATGVVAVSAGGRHFLYITDDKKLWAAGLNYVGELGDGTTIDRDTPVQVAVNVIGVATGKNHSLYVTGDGKLYAMVENSHGQLGNGNGGYYAKSITPAQVSGGEGNVVAVAAGDAHSLFITSDGKLWAMGANNYGQLGDGTTFSSSTPRQITGGGKAEPPAGAVIVTMDGLSADHPSLHIRTVKPGQPYGPLSLRASNKMILKGSET